MTLSDYMDGDLDAMLSTDEFAVVATVGGVTMNGIFDRPYRETLDTAGYAPVLWVRTSDASAAVYGSAVTVNATSYTVAAVEPDGTGVTALVLTEV